MPINVRFIVDGLEKLSQDAIKQVMLVTAAKVAAKSDELFDETHKGFSAQNQPVKDNGIRRYAKSVKFKIGRKGPIYSLVSGGAKEHEIEPISRNEMVFQSGYKPATQLNVLSSSPRQSFGPRVARKFVEHPGFEARRFDIIVAIETGDYISRNFDEVCDVAQKAIDSYG